MDCLDTMQIPRVFANRAQLGAISKNPKEIEGPSGTLSVCDCDSPWVPLYMDIDTPSSSRELHRPLPVASNPRRNLRRMSTKEAHEEAESESKAIPTTTATSQSSQVVNNISSSSGGTAGCPPTLERSPKRRKLRVMNTEEALAEAFK